MKFTRLLETINDILDLEIMTPEQIIETLVVRMNSLQLDSANRELVAIYDDSYQDHLEDTEEEIVKFKIVKF